MKQKNEEPSFKNIMIITLIIIIVVTLAGLLGGKLIRENLKPNCEKNPNEKGCICEEYSSKIYELNIPRDKNDMIVEYVENLTGYCDLINFDEEIATYRCFNENVICVKSHSSNECEKGNKDYVLENKTRIEKIANPNFTWCTSFFLDFQCELFNRTSKKFKSDCIYVEKRGDWESHWNQGYCDESDEWLDEYYQFCVKRELEHREKCRKTLEFIENKIIEYECRKKTDLEFFKEKLDSYDCYKLALDFTEDCDILITFLNRGHYCEYNYYKESDEKLKEIFLLKNCEAK